MENKRDKGWDEWWNERSLPEQIVLGVGFALLGVGLIALYGLIVQALWNWLMPDIFGLKTLDYWQALGLPALIGALFIGVGGGDKSSSGERKRKRTLRRYVRVEAKDEGDPQ